MNAAATKPEAVEPLADVTVERIPLDQLHDSPLNPRKHFDQAAIEQLKDNLLQTGQLTPVLVRPRPKGGFEIAAGHRRLRAARLAVEVSPKGAEYRGLNELLAVVRDMDDKTFLEILTIENLQREGLHPLEEADGFADLQRLAGYDVAKIAARTGRSEKYVYDRLKLRQLIPAAKKLFLTGVFEAGHAIILARLTTEQQKQALGELEDAAAGDRRASLLFEGQGGGENEELSLADQVKPVSVREFQHAVNRHIRATPETVDPFLFPESAAALAAAKEDKLAVIYITRDHLVHDDAKDDKVRTYGAPSWYRADGQPETDRFGDTEKSKTCDWSRYGLVAAGPGKGEVFRVCINREKCKIHWPEQAAAAERRKKAAKKDAKAGGTTNQEKAADREKREVEKQRESQQRDQQDRARWSKARPQLLEALAKAIKHAPVKPDTDVWDIVRATFGHSSTAAKQFPVGKTADALIRHLAYTHLAAHIGADYWIREFAPKALKRFGLDATKIVDEVAPLPKPAKSADARKPGKAPKAVKAKKAKAKK